MKNNLKIQMSETERIQKLQEDLLKTQVWDTYLTISLCIFGHQLQYQRELEQLEKDNKNLKQRLLLKDAGEIRRQKKIKVCQTPNMLIDVECDSAIPDRAVLRDAGHSH
jgi:hypothetical protein